MRCRLCKRKAIYGELRFCDEHFCTFFEKKVKEYLDRAHITGRRVLVAVSGGKDSAALAAVLATVKEEYNIDLALFTINLQIPEYSDDGLAAVKKLAEKVGLPLIVWDLAEFKHTITDFTTRKTRHGKVEQAKPCSQCGVIKRYLLNKAAVEGDEKTGQAPFDVVATGHNMDDEHYFAIHSLEGGDVVQLLRSNKQLPPRPDLKMAGRLKPIYHLTEKEAMLYCMIKGLPVDHKECPYSKGNPQLTYKEQAGLSRQKKSNTLRVLRKLKRMIDENGTSAETALEETNKNHRAAHDNQTKNTDDAGRTGGLLPKILPCPSCGYPTTRDDSCIFCRLMEIEKSSKKE